LNIPLNKSFANWAGSILPYDRDIYIIANSPEEEFVKRARDVLQLIGIDRVVGYASAGALERIAAAGDKLETMQQTDVAEVSRASGVQILDVRTGAERSGGFIPHSSHAALQSLAANIAKLDPTRPVAVHCAGGARSSIAASLLVSRGFTDVRNIPGGFGEWKKAGLPTESEVRADHLHPDDVTSGS
jgi:hydroxyacylglutathione hydrolase